MIMKNKRAWIEIVEAFVAILLVAGVLLVVINKESLGKTDISEQVYTVQLSMLREIETNDAFRKEITGISDSSLPVVWDSPNFPQDIKDKIEQRTPTYLNCVGQICDLSDKCTLPSASAKDIFAQEVTITATLEAIKYRKMKLFCWGK